MQVCSCRCPCHCVCPCLSSASAPAACARACACGSSLQAAPVARAVVCVRGSCVPLGVRSCTRLFGSSHGYNHYNHHVQMRCHFAAFALRASARAGALDAIVNVTVDTIHTISTSALVVIYAVLTVSAMGVAWALHPQNTHDRAQTGAGAFGAAKKPAKMRSRDLSTRAAALCTVHTAHKTHKTRTAASIALTGGLLAVLVLAAQVVPARAYACTSNAHCQYSACRSRNGWCSGGRCVSSLSNRVRLHATPCAEPKSKHAMSAWLICERQCWH